MVRPQQSSENGEVNGRALPVQTVDLQQKSKVAASSAAAELSWSFWKPPQVCFHRSAQWQEGCGNRQT